MGLGTEHFSVVYKSQPKTAGKAAIKQAAKAAGKAVGEVAAETTGKATGAVVGKAFGRVIPILNFGFAAWDAVEAGIATKDIVKGPEEEQKLREKIKELQTEANNLVKIYNEFAAKLKRPLSAMDLPYEL